MKSIAEKLGAKPGQTAWMFDAPHNLATVIDWSHTPPLGTSDLILGFVRDKAGVAPALSLALPRYRRGGSLWFAYPKKSGALASDISRDDGWQMLADADLLPVTQVALDADWSALRFRYRDEIKHITRRS